MPEVQDPQQFLDSFLKAAKQAKHRIYLQSMLFEYGNFLTQCEPIFMQKAQEGVDVRITIDTISKRYVGDNPNFYLSTFKIDKTYASLIHTQTNELIKRWSDAGVRFIFTNHPRLPSKILPIFKRNHIKLYLVDETVWVGGINAFDHAFGFIDFMVPFTDPIIVEGLAKQFFQVNNNRPRNNYRIATPQNTVFVDAGLVGKSLIYDSATAIIANAQKSITFMSQFVPDGKLLKELVRVTRNGVKATVITRPLKNFTKFPYSIPYQTFLQKTKNNSNVTLLHHHIKVHAKLLIVDDQVALFGSHNIVQIGVLLGTEEIAIKTEDTELIRNLNEFISASHVLRQIHQE